MFSWFYMLAVMLFNCVHSTECKGLPNHKDYAQFSRITQNTEAARKQSII